MSSPWADTDVRAELDTSCPGSTSGQIQVCEHVSGCFAVTVHCTCSEDGMLQGLQMDFIFPQKFVPP